MGAVKEACLTFLLLAGLSCAISVSSREVWIRQANNVNQDCSPTPAEFRSSFLSSCYSLLANDSDRCNRAWEAFSRAFAYKSPATVMRSDYSSYFDVLPIEVGPNQSLFWSGVQKLANMVNCMCSERTSIISSENTPSSRIISSMGDIRWCGTIDSSSSRDGIDYTSQCLCSVTTAFWAQFSTEFALAASGTVFYLSYGEKPGGTFQSSSFFATYELPNMSPPRVTEVVILNVHRKGQGESCGTGTLMTLQGMVRERNLSYSCYDVFGDLDDNSKVQELSACASRIIVAEQQATRPAENECFMRAGSDTVLPQRFALVAFAIMTLLALM